MREKSLSGNATFPCLRLTRQPVFEQCPGEVTGWGGLPAGGGGEGGQDRGGGGGQAGEPERGGREAGH